MSHASSPAADQLTSEQLAAITSPIQRLFLEAEPGSGKTTVASNRFGALRFGSAAALRGPGDTRSVIAVSFTRSATAELRGRVLQTWGQAALRRPHRVITIDSLVYELVHFLLTTDAVVWPNGHKQLEVFDSWAVLVKMGWIRSVRTLTLTGNAVIVRHSLAPAQASRPQPAAMADAVYEGRCTHDDVRAVLTAALLDAELRKLLTDHIRSTTRAVIVDEVFDANHLDLAVVNLLMEADVQVTIVGDPWQALYGFRGAQPHLVPALIASTGTTTLPLTAAFRWRDAGQAALAKALRSGDSVTIQVSPLDSVDVVLARQWKQLWGADQAVLPIAIGSPKGNSPEAAATLLLSCFTRRVLGEEGPYTRDALSTLGISPEIFASEVEPDLHSILDILRPTGIPALRNTYNALVEVLSPHSTVYHPPARANYYTRLENIRARLRFGGALIPGMTTHQAKGREWDRVGVRLSGTDVAALAGGLSHDREDHRQLYVAGTRARYVTTAV